MAPVFLCLAARTRVLADERRVEIFEGVREPRRIEQRRVVARAAEAMR